MVYIVLIYEFLKTGLLSVGGGLSTIPFLMEMAHKYTWLTMEELTNFIAISESTPGPVGINMATYVGFNTGGILGSLITTSALVLPSFILIALIAKFLEKYRQSNMVQGAFLTLMPGACAIILYAIIQLLILAVTTETKFGYLIHWHNLIIMIALVAIMAFPKFKRVHPLIWVMLGAILGIIFKL